MRGRIIALLRDTGRGDPTRLTLQDLTLWVTGELETLLPDPLRQGRPRTQGTYGLANNSVRQRMIAASQFLAHCRKNGLAVVDPTEDFARLRKGYPRTYAKAQDRNPARFLSHQEAFGTLIDACRDKTWTGSRDQIVIRLGLAGCRAGEIAAMRWRNVQPGALVFIGKNNRTRRLTLGPALTDALARWRKQYERQIGRPVASDDFLLCRTQVGGRGSRINWGTPMTHSHVWVAVTNRGRLAGLGHVAPHDLRRSTANILHNAKTTDGGHLFDLRDIQQVLDHADPATTQRSYLDPIDTDAKDRAGLLLD